MLELIIKKEQTQKQIALIENGNLVEYYEEDNELERKEGNIYIGIVKDIVKGMQAAFVDIGSEKNSFIHFKDLLPKIDETKLNEKMKKQALSEAQIHVPLSYLLSPHTSHRQSCGYEEASGIRFSGFALKSECPSFSITSFHSSLV